MRLTASQIQAKPNLRTEHRTGRAIQHPRQVSRHMQDSKAMRLLQARGTSSHTVHPTPHSSHTDLPTLGSSPTGRPTRPSPRTARQTRSPAMVPPLTNSPISNSLLTASRHMANRRMVNRRMVNRSMGPPRHTIRVRTEVHLLQGSSQGTHRIRASPRTRAVRSSTRAVMVVRHTRSSGADSDSQTGDDDAGRLRSIIGYTRLSA